jgi:acetyltransferase-like isoleucine patch superfamily enzyme
MITSLVVVLSNAKIGMAAFIGSCSCITENVSIGKGVMIGAGTIISRDIPDGAFFLGNPARMINKIELPTDL